MRSARQDRDILLPLGACFSAIRSAWERCARVPREVRGEGGHVSSHHARPRVILFQCRWDLSATPSTGVLLTCTARTALTDRAVRLATFRQRCEDYERVAVDLRNVCDDCRRIAIPGVAARRRHRVRVRENDLGPALTRLNWKR